MKFRTNIQWHYSVGPVSYQKYLHFVVRFWKTNSGALSNKSLLIKEKASSFIIINISLEYLVDFFYANGVSGWKSGDRSFPLWFFPARFSPLFFSPQGLFLRRFFFLGFCLLFFAHRYFLRHFLVQRNHPNQI